MAKWVKRIMGAAAVGAAIAGLVYYFNNKCSGEEDDEFSEEFDDEDFNLDEDLKPASDREYVPLNQTAKPDADSDNAGKANVDETGAENKEKEASDASR